MNEAMELEIRQALESEINTLLDFEQEIISAERPFDSTLKDDEIHYYDLIELIKSENAEVLVAVKDGEVIGSGYAKILPAKSYLKHTQYAYLGFMYVKPAFRGQGVNLKILQSLTEWAKGENISEVRLEVYNENKIAINAYLKSGFKPNLLEMRLEI
jgi:GNAT superfamily N-acetyltransferase